MVIRRPRAGMAPGLAALLAAGLLLVWGTAGFPQEPAQPGTPPPEPAPSSPAAIPEGTPPEAVEAPPS